MTVIKSLQKVRLYDIASGSLKQSFYGHKGRINHIGFEKGQDSKRIVSCSNDKRYVLYTWNN